MRSVYAAGGGSTSCMRLPATGRRGTTNGYTPMSIARRQPSTVSSGSSPIPRITYVETCPSPKTSTARSQTSKYRSIPVRALPGAPCASTFGSNVQVRDCVQHAEVRRRLELHLDRQARGAFDRLTAAGDIPCPTIDAVRAAGGERRVNRGVERLGGDRDLGELVRGLLHDRAPR